MQEGHQEQSFVFRMWSDGEGQWRFSLEPLRGGIRRYFASWLDLTAYLEQQREETCPSEPVSQP